jgi:hypothetical protein
VEEALEAEVNEALGRGYYENGASPVAGIATAIAVVDFARRRAQSSTASRR